MILSDKSKRVTIKVVAQAVRISTPAISRVMNKFSCISGKTYQRVKSTVEQFLIYSVLIVMKLQSNFDGFLSYPYSLDGLTKNRNEIISKGGETKGE